jgi:hypothetical protein
MPVEILPATYVIEVNWPAIIAAADRVNTARLVPGHMLIGHQGVYDAWSGTCGTWIYETKGLAGLVSLAHGASLIRHAAWDLIHKAYTTLPKTSPSPRSSKATKTEYVRQRNATLAKARGAVLTCFALHDLYTLLAATAIITYDPHNTICGIDEYIHVTGLRWLAGESSEQYYVYAKDARDFADGADPSVLLRCQDLSANMTTPVD